MTATRANTWLRAATGLLLAGAGSWLAKFAVVFATESDDGALVSLLWAAGFFLMLFGAASLAVWLTARLHVVLRIIAALVGGLVFFLSMNVIDSVAKSILGDVGPTSIQEEWGILAAAILWLCIGLGAGALQRSDAVARAV